MNKSILNSGKFIEKCFEVSPIFAINEFVLNVLYYSLNSEKELEFFSTYKENIAWIQIVVFRLLVTEISVIFLAGKSDKIIHLKVNLNI